MATHPTHRVLFTRSVAKDLESIYRYVAAESPQAAARLLDRLIKTIDGLARFPERGNYPDELSELGIRAYRQVVQKPYRIIYRIEGGDVVIDLIADGRRNFQALLARRLLSR